MPHSLGHFLGLYTHDVGPCYFPKDKDGVVSDIPHTRAAPQDVILEPGMVLTVEPGIYFNRLLITQFQENTEVTDLFDWERVEEYFEVGGVRIEDDVIVTEDGFENMSILPRTVEEIEEFMAKENITEEDDTETQ